MSDLIDFNNIVGESTVENGGYAGQLISLISSHVQLALTENRITQSEAGAIYVSTLSPMIKEAADFELAKELTENKIELGNNEIALSLIKIALANKELELADANLELKFRELELKTVELEIEQANLAMMPGELELQAQNILLKKGDVAMLPDVKAIKTAEKKVAEQDVIIKTAQAVMAADEKTIKSNEALISATTVDIKEGEKDLQDLTIEGAIKEIAIKESSLALSNTKVEQEAYTLDHLMPAQLAKEEEQTLLYRRQIQGFDENELQKGYDKVMEIWGITYSSLPAADALPGMMRTSNVDVVLTQLYEQTLGITVDSPATPCPAGCYWDIANKKCVKRSDNTDC